MILCALADYYDRKPKADEAADGLAPVGMEENGIGFAIVIDHDGSVVNIADLRLNDGRKKSSRPTIVPMSCDRPGKNSWQTAFLLWDYPRYVVGVLGEKDTPDMAARRINSFREAYRAAFPDLFVDPGVQAVHAFYENFAANLRRLKADSLWPDVESTTFGISFRLRDVPGELVCQSAVVRQRAKELFEEDTKAPFGQCLVSGKQERLQVLHPATPVAGAKATAKILSFNERAYESYGKRERQGENAPVGKAIAFSYTTALNYLLRNGSRQKLRVGDDTVVFWASRDNSMENDFAAFFDEPDKETDPDSGTRAVNALFESARQGVGPVLDDQTRFFVLGLAPNSARIAIRFWLTGTVAEMADKILRHFRDLEIARHLDAKPYLSLKTLLRSIAAQSDIDNVPPNLAGELMRSILQGTPYPETLFNGALRRVRAEQSAKDKRTGKALPNVTYPRAAILKACLNRKLAPDEKEITVSLDKNNTNPGYRLGRLFAVLEQVQKESNPGLNATIRDRYYGAFSATPASIFSLLMRLKNHHLAKLDSAGRRSNLEKLIGEIVDGLPPTLPMHLSLQDQGRFAIGYYHQRMDSGTYRNNINIAKENDNG